MKGLRCIEPVTLGDLLAVSDGAVWVLHVETHPHGLVHNVEHVNVGVIEDGSHLLQALLTHLQQLTRGCYRVKAASANKRQKAPDYKIRCFHGEGS